MGLTDVLIGLIRTIGQEAAAERNRHGLGAGVHANRTPPHHPAP